MMGELLELYLIKKSEKQNQIKYFFHQRNVHNKNFYSSTFLFIYIYTHSYLLNNFFSLTLGKCNFYTSSKMKREGALTHLNNRFFHFLCTRIQSYKLCVYYYKRKNGKRKNQKREENSIVHDTRFFFARKSQGMKIYLETFYLLSHQEFCTHNHKLT